MEEQLRVTKPRGIGIRTWDIKKKLEPFINKVALLTAGIYLKIMTNPLVVFAADKKTETGGKTDTGVEDVTAGIGVIKDLVLGCVGGVGVIFLAWGLLDFGTAYAAHQTSEQSQAIKKVVGGLIMVAVPSILTLLGV